MKKTFTKILSVVLCAVMVLGAAPLGGLVGLDLPQLFDLKAEAATYSGKCGTNLTWSLDTETGVLNITGTGAMKNYQKFSFAPWDSYRGYIKTVNIASGVTTIGDYAFYGCTNLTSVTIPDSVTTIGESAFEVCDSLTSVTIPDSVTTIGDYAFRNCDSLTNITVDEDNKYFSSNSDGVLFNKDKTTIIQYPAGNARTSYTIPNSVTTIGDSAFYSCDSLTSVTIPDSVTTIGSTAFRVCDNLTSITIPDSVTTIGEEAFEVCESLTNITVDTNNKYYSSDSYGALFNKDKTTLIQYPIGNTRTSYTIPDSVTTIGNSAFCACNSLTSVTISSSVTIGIYAFCRCENLTRITILNSVTTIDHFAFMYCTKLTSVTIPDSVTTIGYEAFYNCNSLTDVYYIGRENQWKNISISSYNDSLLNATIHYNHAHALNNVIESVDPTCYKTGYKTIGCVCGYSLTEEIPALNHKDTLVKVAAKAPTCTEIGWDAYEYCTACTYTTYAEKPALKHDIIIDKAVDATCTETGLTEGQHCSRCDDATIKQEVVPALNHKDTLVKVAAKAPTCTEIGWDAYEYCTACDYTTYVEKAALKHDIIIDKAVDATCTETGLTEGQHCSRCGDATIKQEVVPALNHKDTLVKVAAKAPTCTEIGWDAYEYCTACTHTTYAEKPALKHDIIIDKAVDATCTETGLTEGQHCSRCDNATIKQEVVPALKHKDTLVKVAAKAPTCTEIGWDAYEYCTACTYTTYVEKAALKHDIVIDKAVEPTCTQTGLTEGQHCSRCDDATIKQEVVPALKHKDTLVKVAAKAPTCTEIGWDAYEYCTACTYTTYKEKAALKHDIIIDKAVDATCTETGLTEGQHCSRCDDATIKQEVVPVKPHNYTAKHDSAKHWEECVCGAKTNVQNHTFVGSNVCSCGFKRTVDSTVKIKNNSGAKTINYGETLKLMATVTDKPANAKIYWYVDGEQKGEGEIFEVKFESGTKIISVKLVDENGVVYQNANGEEISESENVTVNAGFFQKLISFFKNLFRMNRTVVQ